MTSEGAGARTTNVAARTGDCDTLALEAGALALEGSSLTSRDHGERSAAAATGGMLALESGATLSAVEPAGTSAGAFQTLSRKAIMQVQLLAKVLPFTFSSKYSTGGSFCGKCDDKSLCNRSGWSRIM